MTRGAGIAFSCATNLAARSIRSGSSEKATSGSSGVSSRLPARSLTPPKGSTNSPSGSRTAMALIVKSRLERSSQEVFAERHRGLPVLLRVDLFSERRDLDERSTFASSDGAVLRADQGPTFCPSLENLQGLSREGIGGEVEIVPMVTPKQQVPHHPADEVELVTGQAETLAELGGDRGDLEARAAVRTRPVGHDGLRIPLRPRPPAHRTPRGPAVPSEPCAPRNGSGSSGRCRTPSSGSCSAGSRSRRRARTAARSCSTASRAG